MVKINSIDGMKPTFKSRAWNWLKKSWELKIIFAVPSALSLLSPWLPRDLIWFASLPYALIKSWDKIITILGKMIGHIPFVPEVSYAKMNIIILTTAASHASYLMFSNTPTKHPVKYLFLGLSLGACITLLVTDFSTSSIWHTFSSSKLYFLLIIVVTMLLAEQSKKFRSAIIIFIGISVTLQLLYWLKILPWADTIDKFISAEMISFDG